MIKIAFFDVDGTLLKMGHKELSERTLHALISLRQNGVKLCMATGRGYLSAPVWLWGMRRMRSKPTPPAHADRWKKTESTIFA